MKQITNPVLRTPYNVGIKPVWDKNCKVLILGSITATDGINKGFYYASARNQMWELLDYCLGFDTTKSNSCSGYKNQLKQNYEDFCLNKISSEQFENNKQAIIKKFSKLLLSHGIAICDVFRECYFNNGSSLDCDIILNNSAYPYVTNKQTIEQIINNSNIETVVVNSRFVETQFKKLKIAGNYKIEYVISPSPRRGAISTKTQNWKQVFGKLNIKE